jgi:hypothetical protein
MKAGRFLVLLGKNDYFEILLFFISVFNYFECFILFWNFRIFWFFESFLIFFEFF